MPSSSQGPNLECPKIFMEQNLLRGTVCIPLGGLLDPGKASSVHGGERRGYYHIPSGSYILTLRKHRIERHLALTLHFISLTMFFLQMKTVIIIPEIEIHSLAFLTS